MYTQSDFNVLEIGPNPVPHHIDSWLERITVPASRMNPGLKGVLGVLVAQLLILGAGVLFWSFAGVPLVS